MLLKATLPFIWGLLLYQIPMEMMPPKAWYLFIVFSATILGIMVRAFPIAVVALFGMTACVLFNILDIKTQAFYGFGVPTVWLVGCVFFIAKGFTNSRLGERIAYFFILLAGRTPLRLAYALVLTELVCSPMIPSSTARAGGILLPILQSICCLFKKGDDNKISAFLIQCAFHANIICSSLFLTGMVTNPLAQSLARGMGVNYSWIDWFMIACVPGVLCLLLAPLIVYFMNKPTLEDPAAVQSMAKDNLEALGGVSSKEKTMIGILMLMLFLWIFGDGLCGIGSAAVALLGLVLCLLTKIISFDEVLSEKKAWETMLWLSILITMSTFLKEYGFIEVLSAQIQHMISGYSVCVAILCVLTFYYWSGYFFASNAAHISALYVSFLGVLISLGITPVLAGVGLAVLSGMYASATHYGSTSGSVLFSAGLVSMKEWWTIGLVVTAVNFVIWIGVGSLWWKVLGYL